MKHIMLVDDDTCIIEMLRELLEKEGYSVTAAYSGSEALLAIPKRRPDLILLDLMLPGLSGEEVLSKIQGIPAIIISAKDNIDDKVSVLLGGAADYLTKPFDPRELLARITVALRNAATSGQAPVLTYENIFMDTAQHLVTVEKTPIKLTKTEFSILKLLLINQTQIIPKSTMLERLSLDTPDCMESSLKVHISNLRKKLKNADPFHRDFIEAVWGIGFKLTGAPE